MSWSFCRPNGIFAKRPQRSGGHARSATRPLELLPLYARLSGQGAESRFCRSRAAASGVGDQRCRVVADRPRDPGRRGVGTARISRYSPRSKVQRLPIEAVSQASADQRKGRCGRVGPGICIRLYDEEDYLGRDEYTTPEIRRTNLAAVILQTMALRLGADRGISRSWTLHGPRPFEMATRRCSSWVPLTTNER